MGTWGEDREAEQALALGRLVEVFGTGRGVRWGFGAGSWGLGWVR